MQSAISGKSFKIKSQEEHIHQSYNHDFNLNSNLQQRKTGNIFCREPLDTFHFVLQILFKAPSER